jgi:hypothetical protein
MADIQTIQQWKAQSRHYKQALVAHWKTLSKGKELWCVVTHHCNHAYSDEFTRDANGETVLVYRGQKVANHKDPYLLNPDIPKVLMIKKGSRGRFPNQIFGDWGRYPTYFFGGRITRVVLVTPRNPDISVPHPEPIYHLYFDPEQRPTMTEPHPLTPEWHPYIELMPSAIKLTALLAHGFLPTTQTYSQGILLCTGLKTNFPKDSVGTAPRADDVGRNVPE